MKNNLTRIVILIVLSMSLIIFTGCAEKKQTVKSEPVKVQETTPAPAPEPVQTTDASKQGAAEAGTAKFKDAGNEKSAGTELKETQSPLRDINFDFDSSAIRPDAREILQANAGYISKHRVTSIVVEGHCDERGTAEYNMALGERRAQETKKYLVNLGVKESLLKTISYGSERPLDFASTEEAWAKNRRAHFVVNP